jgi:hypothetical protein
MVVYFAIEMRIFRTTPVFFIHPVYRSIHCYQYTFSIITSHILFGLGVTLSLVNYAR